MLVSAVGLTQVALAVHILAVVIGFGVIFAYPILGVVGARMDARAMPWFHRMQGVLGRRLISPGLVLILLAGAYLASKQHQWSSFYVQWGMGVVILIGGLSGAYMNPNERRLGELAERDIAAAGDGEVKLSAEYEALRRRVALITVLSCLLVVITVYLMTVRAGA